MGYEEEIMNLEDLVKKEKLKRWIALFVTDRDFISDDGEQFSPHYLWMSGNQTRLIHEIESYAWGEFYTGYLWHYDDPDIPRFLIERKVNEKRNVVTNRLILVPYEEVMHFAMHTPDDVETFIREAKESGHLRIGEVPGRK